MSLSHTGKKGILVVVQIRPVFPDLVTNHLLFWYQSSAPSCILFCSLCSVHQHTSSLALACSGRTYWINILDKYGLDIIHNIIIPSYQYFEVMDQELRYLANYQGMPGIQVWALTEAAENLDPQASTQEY